MKPDGMLVRPSDPEHPAVAPAAPDRAPNLVGEGRKRHLFVRLRQCAGQCPVRPVPARFRGAERGDRLLEPALHQVHEPVERDLARGGQVGRLLERVAVDGMQEHRGADPLVQVLGALAKRLDLLAGQEDLGGRCAGDQGADRAVAQVRVGAGDGLDQKPSARRHGLPGSVLPWGMPATLARGGVRAVLLDPDDRFE